MWLLGAIVAIAAIVTFSLIVSTRGTRWPRHERRFQCSGAVVGTRAAEGEMLLRVEAGSRTIGRRYGAQLVVALSASTALAAWDGHDTGAAPSVADLAPGTRVSVSGVVERASSEPPVFRAARVIVQPAPADLADAGRAGAGSGARRLDREDDR